MRARSWIKRMAGALALAVALPLGVQTIGGGAIANAAFDPNAEDFWVDSDMGGIKNRVWRAHDGNTSRVVYLLDGLRARDDLNGWEIETNVGPFLASQNINVVMPVGGESSFYSDWISTSNFNGQETKYSWESFLTQNLPNALANRYGFQSWNNGIIGISMGGSAALTLAAYHPQQFNYAGSLSGYLNISAPGMREAIRVAMLDAGRYNVDAMWGPPWNPAWLRNDPFVFANKLRDNNTRLWVSAGSGVPAPGDPSRHSLTDVVNTGSGSALEVLSVANSRAFQVKLAAIGAHNVTYNFQPRGVHSWRYWEPQIHDLAPDLSATIG
ncbi:esterase family protein [Rhodococcus rhodnii]|uniref:Antigen 85 complex protein n=2 Tax=Rhodococcus rhodnii TaxID=38312 RepID=R7WRQ4_9NOCA|nr:alpha/beta hydrolase family protein [Rhodococcus rhodnii]EOM76639.1 antigen 85 complex protein [Rhodococcus rhodnii LMG 5362]TXG89511.1 esterase family protein [Rhodococcus rhodnii]